MIVKADAAITGSPEDATEWAAENLPQRLENGETFFLTPEQGVSRDNIFSRLWRLPLGPASEAMILLADASTRLSASLQQQSTDPRTQFATHPIQKAARRPGLEQAFDEIGRQAFGLGITVNRQSGPFLSLLVGEPPPFQHVNGAPTPEYLDDLARMGRVDDQGDGVKSFLGLMIYMLTGSQQVLLIDEPEAFLHPPQARLLGKLLADQAADRQVFVSTHSADIVQGVLNSSQNMTIIRLTREGDTNHACHLDDAAVKALWSDPLLRYSEVLSGLFHDAVVLCEGDADCRYYAAVRDHLFAGDSTKSRRPELLFTHCGGKYRMPMVITALESVDVPVLAVADFDILREGSLLRKVYEGVGGAWGEIETDQRTLASALGQGIPLTKTQASSALSERLDAAGEILTKHDVEDLRRLLKLANGWDRTKAEGLAGLDSKAAKTASAIMAKLQERRVFVVPVGELENFVPSIQGKHGPAWVAEVLATGLHRSPSRVVEEFLVEIERAAHAGAGLRFEYFA